MSIRKGFIAASLAVLGALAAAQVSAGEGDEQFLQHAIQTDIAEVKLAELALQRSNDDGVRGLAHRLQTDHSASMQEATTLARTLRVTIPSAATEESQQHYATLEKLSGAAFDEAFVAHMVEGHREAVREFREVGQANANQSIAGLAAKTLPTLEEHLAIAEELHASATNPAGPHAGGQFADQPPVHRAPRAAPPL